MMETDEKELLKAAMRGIRPVMEKIIITGGLVDTDRMVLQERQNVHRWWRENHPVGYARMAKETEELDHELDRLTPVLIGMTRDLEMKARVSLKVRAVSETGAVAMTGAVLDGAGYHDYTFIRQRHRIKVVVRFAAGVAVLPLKFSAFPGIVDRIVPALRDMERIRSEFGKDMHIG